MSNNETNADRQNRYNRVLSTIDSQTSQEQLPGCSEQTVRLCLIAHGPLEDADKVRKGLRAAVENEDCVKWEDRNGVTRYTLTNGDDLRRLLVYESQKENPREEIKNRVRSHLP